VNIEKQLRARLDNKAYVKNAPKEVVEQTKQQIKDAKNRLAALEAEMERFTITPTEPPENN
jgi:valyl-tRNA synthetase